MQACWIIIFNLEKNWTRIKIKKILIKIMKWHNVDELNQTKLKIGINLKLVAKKKKNISNANKVFTFHQTDLATS